MVKTMLPESVRCIKSPPPTADGRRDTGERPKRLISRRTVRAVPDEVSIQEEEAQCCYVLPWLWRWSLAPLRP